MLNQVIKRVLKTVLTAQTIEQIVTAGISLIDSGVGYIPGDWDDAAWQGVKAKIKPAELAKAIETKIFEWIDLKFPTIFGGANHMDAAQQNTAAIIEAGCTDAIKSFQL